MGLFDWFRSERQPAPMNQHQGATEMHFGSLEELRQYLEGQETAAGVSVNHIKAMQIAAVYASVRIITGSVANLPIHIKEETSEGVKVDRRTAEVWKVLRKRPNGFMTPLQFRRYMQASQLLKGEAIAVKVMAGDKLVSLLPLNKDHVETVQNADMSLSFKHTHPKTGTITTYNQDQVFRLVGLSLDGVNGVTPITYARETIGLSLAQERFGSKSFANGLNASVAVTFNGSTSSKGGSANAYDNLRTSVKEFVAGGDQEGGVLVLPEVSKVERLSMTAQDAEWIASRKHTRSEIAMFFGIPPHMIGDTEKSTSWGSGIEQQSIGFVRHTLEDYISMWEDAIDSQLIDPDSEMYARVNRSALVRADIKTRYEAHALGLQWGFKSPDEVRNEEDMNPREDGKGGEFYPPPNMTKSEETPEPEPSE